MHAITLHVSALLLNLLLQMQVFCNSTRKQIDGAFVGYLLNAAVWGATKHSLTNVSNLNVHSQSFSLSFFRIVSVSLSFHSYRCLKTEYDLLFYLFES